MNWRWRVRRQKVGLLAQIVALRVYLAMLKSDAALGRVVEYVVRVLEGWTGWTVYRMARIVLGALMACEMLRVVFPRPLPAWSPARTLDIVSAVVMVTIASIDYKRTIVADRELLRPRPAMVRFSLAWPAPMRVWLMWLSMVESGALLTNAAPPMLWIDNASFWATLAATLVLGVSPRPPGVSKIGAWARSLLRAVSWRSAEAG